MSGVVPYSLISADAVDSLVRHELSSAWGDMPKQQLEELLQDVERNGQREPVVLFGGKVLDGWHRAKVCCLLGRQVKCRELPVDEDPLRWVISMNGRRRHQTAGQRALAITRCTAWRPAGRPRSVETPPSRRDLVKQQDIQPLRKLTTREMARLAEVNDRTMERAKAVLRKAIPEVQQAVERGEVGLNRAAEIARLPSDHQIAALEQPGIPNSDASVVPQDPDVASDPSSLEALANLDPSELAAIASGDTSLDEHVDELLQENGKLRAELEVAAASDAVAEALKWRRLYDVARRSADQAMDQAHKAGAREKEVMNALRKCAKALGESNPWNTHIAIKRLLAERNASEPGRLHLGESDRDPVT